MDSQHGVAVCNCAVLECEGRAAQAAGRCDNLYRCGIEPTARGSCLCISVSVLCDKPTALACKLQLPISASSALYLVVKRRWQDELMHVYVFKPCAMFASMLRNAWINVFSSVLQGASPGYGISLIAETDAGRFIAAERCIAGTELLAAREAQVTADDVGTNAACLLLDEIKRCALAPVCPALAQRMINNRIASRHEVVC